MEISDLTELFKVSHPYFKFLIAPVIALILDFLQRRFFKKLNRHLSRTRKIWDDALCRSIPTPLSFIIWGIAVSLILIITNKVFQGTYDEEIKILRSVYLIVIFTWFFLRLSKNIETKVIERAKREKASEAKHHTIDQTTALALGKVSQVIICLIGALIILPTLGYSISGLLAFGGAGALIISLAAQNLLSNFFGGLMIYLDRPFAIGDWIRSPDQNIEGVVEHIGWRVTRIRTFDKRPLYVPNSVFTKVSVENPSRMWNRRIKTSIGVRYDDVSRLPVITERIQSFLRNHEEIDQNQTLIVAFNEFNDSSLDILIYTFTKTTVWVRFHEIKQEVYLSIAKIIEEEGAEVAFPTSTVHFGDGEFLESMQKART